MSKQLPNPDRIHYTPGQLGGDYYPQSEFYQWQEFAGWAIEFGGYGDVSIISPYNGDRLCITCDYSAEPPTIFDQLRELVDVMEDRAHQDEVARTAAALIEG